MCVCVCVCVCVFAGKVIFWFILYVLSTTTETSVYILDPSIVADFSWVPHDIVLVLYKWASFDQNRLLWLL